MFFTVLLSGALIVRWYQHESGSAGSVISTDDGFPDLANTSRKQESTESPTASAGGIRDDVDLRDPAVTTRYVNGSDTALNGMELVENADRILLARPTGPESSWMRRRGYPSYDEWRARGMVSTEDLEARVSHGDLIAAAMLADRLADSNPQRAEALLETALDLGSVFAATRLAEHAARDNAAAAAKGEPARYDGIVAFSQLAALLGDYRATDLQTALMGMKSLPPGQLGLSTRQAFKRIEAINAARRQRGLPDLAIAIRPGLAEWNIAVHGNDTPVETIRIDCRTRPDLCAQTSKSP